MPLQAWLQALQVPQGLAIQSQHVRSQVNFNGKSVSWLCGTWSCQLRKPPRCFLLAAAHILRYMLPHLLSQSYLDLVAVFAHLWYVPDTGGARDPLSIHNSFVII
jgi:hypothetical protein